MQKKLQFFSFHMSWNSHTEAQAEQLLQFFRDCYYLAIKKEQEEELVTTEETTEKLDYFCIRYSDVYLFFVCIAGQTS